MKTKTFSIITTIIFLIIFSLTVFSTATLYVTIYKNGVKLTTLSTDTVTCTDDGEIQGSINWGSYNDCKTNGQGTYTSTGIIEGTLTCTENEAPPTSTSPSPIVFCSAPDCSRTVTGFCDTTDPGNVNFNPNNGWYNRDFTITGTYTDNYKVYEILYGYKKASSSTYNSNSALCSSFSTSCSSTLTISTTTCNEEGLNKCNLRAKSLDYWNEESTYSYANYNIDFTPPEEPIITIDDSNPYVYYDSNTNTLYYTNIFSIDGFPQGNVTITVNVKDDTTNTNEVAGIYSINFPNFFGTGERTYSYSTFRQTAPLNVIQSHTYIISSSSTNQGTLTITITDSAGNVRTKNINVVLDNTPPQNVPPINVLLEYEHQITKYDYDKINFNLNYGTTTDTGVGLGFSNIYVSTAEGDEDETYKTPICGVFSPANFNQNTRMLTGIPTTNTNVQYDDDTRDLLKNGYCHIFYIEVCDKIYNCVKLQYDTNTQNLYGQDSTEGENRREACTFFSTYDNCNNRAIYFNGKKAVKKEIPDCSGSCIGGRIEYNDNNEVKPSYNNKIEVLSKEDFYTYSNIYGFYRIYNITPILKYQLRAYPNETQLLFAEKTTPIYDLTEKQNILGDELNIVVDNANILLGLDFSLCTDSCTLKTDPFGTCYTQCSDSNFVNCAKDENGNIDEEKLTYLQACNGKKSGTRIINPSNPSEYIECCQGPIIPKIDKKINIKVEDADNVLKTERVVYYKGRLVRLVVVVFK